MVLRGRIGSGFGRLMASLRAFRRDDRGSVTLQVIFFSLMVFGATGVVLDAGRVYDTHSRLQIYADHMAHLAANELDRQTDSVQRATNAVYASTGDAATLIMGADENAGIFQVQKLEFFSGMETSDSVQNDMSEAFPAALGVATTEGPNPDVSAEASQEAAFVVVTVSADVSAVTRIVTQTIPNMGYEHPVNAGTPGQLQHIGPERYDLQVKSAATLERESCAELTTLVMCNPWEDQTGAADALSVPKPAEGETNANYTVPGRSLMFFAPNFANSQVPDDRLVESGEDHGSLFPWDVNHQLFQIDTPVADPAGVCSDNLLRDLAGQVLTGDASSQEYLDARDRCLMARANAPQVCWSDEDPLTIRPANGDTVLRSVNTIFDIWNAPFEQMVQDTTLLDPTGALPYTAADFFQPDRLATTTYETADRFGVDTTGVHACEIARDGDGNPVLDANGFYVVDDPRLVPDGIPDYNHAWPCDDPNTFYPPNADGTPNLIADPNFTAAHPDYDVNRDESHASNATPDSFQPAYDTIPKPGWTYLAGTRGEGIGYDFCHDKTLGRQDTARQNLSQCLLEAESNADPDAAAAICQADYIDATSFDTCAASATPGRETAECGCAIDFVGDHHQGGAPLYMFARARGFRNSLYDWAGMGLNPNSIFRMLRPEDAPLSWYEFYTKQREIQESVVTNGSRSRVAVWNGAAPAVATDPQDTIADYGIPTMSDSLAALPPGTTLENGEHSVVNEGYVKHYPDDFLALTGNPPSSSATPYDLSAAMQVGANRERRRMRAAMVNCGVVTGLTPDENGETRALRDDGTYEVTVDDMRVMDAYVPNPAGMFCGPDSVDCDIAGSVETSMYIELIEDVTEDVITDQYTVRLVR